MEREKNKYLKKQKSNVAMINFDDITRENLFKIV